MADGDGGEPLAVPVACAGKCTAAPSSRRSTRSCPTAPGSCSPTSCAWSSSKGSRRSSPVSAATRSCPTRPPDPALARSPVVTLVRPSILKVSGDAPSCQKAIEGSGFVFSPQHVMTNAHVVAGVPHPSVDVNGTQLAATTVLFDPKRDIAVLYVPGLQARALAFATKTGSAGDSAIVIGYPENGPFTAVSARIRDRLTARGVDIYSQSERRPRDLRHPRRGCFRATPAARCSRPPARCTAWFSLQLRTIRTPATH